MELDQESVAMADDVNEEIMKDEAQLDTSSSADASTTSAESSLGAVASIKQFILRGWS